MDLLAQIPGLDETAKTAVQQAGWLAGLVVVLVAVMVTGSAWYVRTTTTQAAKREEATTARLTILETTDRTESRDLAIACQVALKGNTTALERLNETLDKRPCLLPAETLAKLDRPR